MPCFELHIKLIYIICNKVHVVVLSTLQCEWVLLVVYSNLKFTLYTLIFSSIFNQHLLLRNVICFILEYNLHNLNSWTSPDFKSGNPTVCTQSILYTGFQVKQYYTGFLSELEMDSHVHTYEYNTGRVPERIISVTVVPTHKQLFNYKQVFLFNSTRSSELVCEDWMRVDQSLIDKETYNMINWLLINTINHVY